MPQDILNTHQSWINSLWMIFATVLVFIMHLGFACVESGLVRAKNTINILFKNAMVPAIAILTYSIWGYNLMFPGPEFSGGFIGFGGFGIHASLEDTRFIVAHEINFSQWIDFLFQSMVAATAATIISGGVAERIKLSSFLLFAVLMAGFIYPVIGMWNWGGGWLANMEVPFHDFAGATIVHSVGGWGALAGIIVLGPRLGRYKNGKIHPFPGHSMPLVTIGIFLLWFGWFGINGGSVLSANPDILGPVLVNTAVSASAGAFSAFVTSYLITKTHDLTMVLNGILGGLVGVTAGAMVMGPEGAAITGLISGILVVTAIIFFDKIKIDDPVGVTSVHLVCGIFGTLAVGFIGELAGFRQFISQLIGVLAVGVTIFSISLFLFWFISITIGLRVKPEEELDGLDLSEHGMEAYVMEESKS